MLCDKNIKEAFWMFIFIGVMIWKFKVSQCKKTRDGYNPYRTIAVCYLSYARKPHVNVLHYHRYVIVGQEFMVEKMMFCSLF